ncbi:MAG: DUF359 domain-containing protein [Candidatus Micrarchaeia archaeon]
MKRISEAVKEELRKPFGKAYISPERIISDYPSKKIIAVGDQTVLSFLRIGKKPFISVFDFKSLRKRIPSKDIEYLKKNFSNYKTIRNIPSTVSKRLIHVAPLFLKNGGALRVYGEEDLIALVFLYFANEEFIVVYGQKNKGMIAAETSKNRSRVDNLIDKIIPDLFP